MSDSQIFSASKPRFAAWLVEPMLENRRTYIKVAVAAAMISVAPMGDVLRAVAAAKAKVAPSA